MSFGALVETGSCETLSVGRTEWCWLVSGSGEDGWLDACGDEDLGLFGAFADEGDGLELVVFGGVVGYPVGL